MPEVRPIRPDEAEAMRTLRISAMRTDPEAFASDYEREIQRPVADARAALESTGSDAVFLGAFSGDILVGMIAVHRDRYPKTHHKASVSALFVQPSHRGAGLGRELVKAAISYARQMPNLTRLNLGVVPQQTAALELYRSIGFVQYGIEHDALRSGGSSWDNVLMTLEL